ncbi:MAG: RNA polymerase sigma factor SigZ [Thermomicrobiales bacterium]|nr:RNA polymerase sigma factor SigZ [Thermomicrobiales bacterium]
MTRPMVSDARESSTQQIWAEFGTRLRAFIARRVEDDADADDILQEVFLRVHLHADAVARRERLVAWLFQVTRRAIADYYRAPARRHELLVGAPPDLELRAGRRGSWETEDDAVTGEAARELAHCLRPMVARLPPLYREAVTLIDLEGLPQREAARRAGLSLSGMKSRVQRGRGVLNQFMHECCQLETDAGGRVMDYQLRGGGCGPCAGGCGSQAR